MTPQAALGQYNENGSLNGVPAYRHTGGVWHLYRVNIFTADNWVVSNQLGSADYNNSTIAFYKSSDVATPVANASTVYLNTNSGCGAILVRALPSVTAVSPASGPAAGGDTVTITGTDFSGTPTVRFGITNATGVMLQNSSTLTATAPAGSVGSVGVSVMTTVGTSNADTLYTYIPVPTLSSVSPNSGPAAGGASVTITGTNLNGATAVSFGGTAASAYTVNSATQITANTPAHAAGAVNVAVTTAGGSATLTNGYTYAVLPPTAGAVSATVAANSSANPIPLSLSGGAATSVTVSSAASHGTASASGTSVTYTPTAGYSGADSFSYTASNASGTSAPATVTLTVSAPIIPVSPSTLSSGTVGTAYSTTVSASGGTAPYTYARTSGSLPTGLSLNTSSGVISGMPTVANTFNFTVTATDANSATGSRAYTVVMAATAPSAPTIGTATAGNGQATVSFTAPASNGGAAITSYTATASPGSQTGSCMASPCTVTGLTNGTSYTFIVTATNSAGTGAASAASNAVTPKAAQTITFVNPGAQNFGTAPTLTATASSGLTLTFTSATTGVCTITSGGALTFVAVGNCTINADQVGNGSYLAAAQVSQTFAVNAVVPGAPTIGAATAGNAHASVSFTPPSFTGGATIGSYTVTSSPLSATGTGSASPLVVTGLTNGVAYTFTVVATNTAGTGGASGVSNAVTPKGSQTIVFTNPGAQSFGTSPTLAASAAPGLAVTFTSSTTGVCTITSNGALTFVAVGSCTINADQVGNGSYLAAAQISQTFAVNAVVPGAPTIGTATAGDAQASVSFTAPASNGSSTITGYTVTSNPGGFTGSGASSPIAVNGLANGTTYTFTVTAISNVGTGAASAASNAVIPRLLSVNGAVPGMTGSAIATLSGGGASCTLNPISGFASLSNPAPAGKIMPYGEYAFRATSCAGTVTMVITYPEALPVGIEFWKFGPATASAGGVVAASTWFQLGGVALSGDRTTVTYTVTDNGPGDSNGAMGSISDPFALAAGPVGGGAVGIPVDAPWALGLLSAMLGFLGWRRQRGLSKG